MEAGGPIQRAAGSSWHHPRGHSPGWGRLRGSSQLTTSLSIQACACKFWGRGLEPHKGDPHGLFLLSTCPQDPCYQPAPPRGSPVGVLPGGCWHQQNRENALQKQRKAFHSLIKE